MNMVQENVALQIASSQEGATLRSKGLTAALKELAEIEDNRSKFY